MCGVSSQARSSPWVPQLEDEREGTHRRVPERVPGIPYICMPLLHRAIHKIIALMFATADVVSTAAMRTFAVSSRLLISLNAGRYVLNQAHTMRHMKASSLVG